MDILLTISLSIVLATLGLVIISLIFYYLRLHRKYDEVYKQNLYLKHHFSEKSLEKLNSAHEKSSKIVAEAISQAEEIIQKAELLKDTRDKEFSKELIELSRIQKEALKTKLSELQSGFLEEISNLKEDDINLFQNITKDIEDVATSEIQKFEKQLHDETIGGQSIVEQKINDAFAKANFEIIEYKKEKIEKADKEVFDILQTIAKNLLHKELSYEDHKDLIMEALEDAKKEMRESI